MDGKITLITPPDFYENNNKSVLFINISDSDQEKVTKYLSEIELKENYNFYVFTNETNISWLLYAVSRSDYKFIDLDTENHLVNVLASYMLANNNFFYQSSDENFVAIINHLNQNRITDINKFLERVFDDQKQ
jgi:hypothetical protein